MMIKPILAISSLLLISTHLTNAHAIQVLTRCPNSSNCVSSQTDRLDQEHFIAPFIIKGDATQAWIALQTILKSQSRTRLTQIDDKSLQAETTSLIFHFVDDIQAILNVEANLIDIRSASRVGFGDFGVNRNRIEQLRILLQQGGFIE